MRACAILGMLAALALGQGCSQARASNIPMRFLEEADHPEIAKHYTLDPSWFVADLTGQDFRTVWPKIEGFQPEALELRNPGMLLLVIREREGRPITAKEKLELEKAFAGLVVTKIPYQFGPDGKTLKMMRSFTKVVGANGEYNNNKSLEIELRFETVQKAKAVIPYIDAQSYSCRVTPEKGFATLTITTKTPNQDPFHESFEAQRIAERFKGRLLGIESSG